ncbi:MAG TPA: ROK family protein [Anaerolineales bacterium]|nr:ROK family protein [Anaerolineales bacterium]
MNEPDHRMSALCYTLSMSYHIAIDLGGTQMRAGLFPTGSLHPEKLERIPTHSSGELPLTRLLDLIAAILPANDRVLAIAVAAPGPLDPHTGTIFTAPNVQGFTNLPLRQIIVDRFGIPAAVGNDANLAALGEWKHGAGQGFHNLIYMTISTGIGAGVIVDDHLLLGERGLATELGHVTVDPHGPICPCGKPGHLEAMAAGPAIARWTAAQIQAGEASSLPPGQPITAKAVAQAALSGDPLAIRALERAGRLIGWALADYLHIFNPAAIILGGGVIQSGDLILGPLRQALKEYTLSNHYLEGLSLLTAALGDEAGLTGALALARQIAPEPADFSLT